MAAKNQQRHDRGPTAPWSAALRTAIEMKIGEELRERMELPWELPHDMLALLMQITGDRDRE
jgi:hypothetical protein